MATRGAVANGNWSSLSTWDGGVSLPASGDTVVANGFAVTIDTNVDIGTGTIQTLAAGAFASGGGFTVSSNRTITANILAGTTSCLTVSGSANVTLNGNATGGTTSSDYGVNWGSSGTLTFNGNVTAGSSSSAHGLLISAGTVNLSGNFTATTIDACSVSGGLLNWLSGTGTSTSSANAISCTGASISVAQSITTNASTINPVIELNANAVLVCNGNVTAEAAKYAPIEMRSATATVALNADTTAADGVPVVQITTGSPVVTLGGRLFCSADGTFPINRDNTAGSFRIQVHASNTVEHTYPKASSGTRTLTTASGSAGGGCVVGSPIIKGLSL